MAVDTAIGPEGNLLEPTPEAALHFELPTPVLLNVELEKIRSLAGRPRLARLPVDHAPDPLQGEGRREGAAEGDRGRCGGGAARRSPRGTTSSSSRTAATTGRTPRSRRSSPSRRSSTTSSGRGRGPAWASSSRRASRARCTTSASSSATARARSTPTSRSRRSTTRSRQGLLAGDPRGRGEAVRQGGQQGDREGHLQDGDLDGPELPRRAGLRGARALAGLRRRVLQRDAVADRRHRHQGHRARGGPPARLRLPLAPREAHDARDGRALPVPARRRGAPELAGGDPPPPARVPDGRRQGLEAVQRALEPAREAPGEDPRPDGLPAARRSRFRSRRSSRSRTSSRASRRARCRTARSARRRTRRSPSR